VVCVQQGGLTRFGHRESRFAFSCTLLLYFSFLVFNSWCVLVYFGTLRIMKTTSMGGLIFGLV
jgi:hypothetical protein